MTEQIPSELIQYILLGSGDSKRHMQDSPILGDVWIAYAKDPHKPVDLLITSHKDTTANDLAAEIFGRVRDIRAAGAEGPRIATLQNYVVASLYFDEVIRVLIPMTKWWLEQRTEDERNEYLGQTPGKHRNGLSKVAQTVADVRALITAYATDSKTAEISKRRTAFERFMALCALVFIAGRPPEETHRLPVTGDAWARIQARTKAAMTETSDEEIEDLVLNLLNLMVPAKKSRVWQIARNREASAAIKKSVPAVKADAARRLFNIDCSEIVWAVVDSGVDNRHEAFGETKLVKTFDFTFYRELTDLGNIDDDVRQQNLASIKKARGDTLPPYADAKLKKIAAAAVDRQPMRTDLIREFLDLGDDPPTPASEHGTHVAGIIAASGREGTDKLEGMCPGIGLYDLRILGSDSEDTEFAVIAALQFVRRTNELAGDMRINGVNMSLSIDHDVRNYGCGATPVCLEAERLVDSGVVVVAAAGNFGYQNIMVNDQPFNNYLAFSITDPGNAERVITVGSTHHYAPSTYGVSYFSSRGPTGDGRLKPDLVAPGERIYAPVLDGDWDYLDGTSMAAPHVSGAAALLMARYPELIGKPDKIKRILCETASDLGRERNFQGHGLLDVLRALQSH